MLDGSASNGTFLRRKRPDKSELMRRLHGTSLPFFQQLTKVKPTGDPYPPSGSGKEKILHTEALGLVMIDYGGDVGGVYGDGLGKYGRARCKLAIVRVVLGPRLIS